MSIHTIIQNTLIPFFEFVYFLLLKITSVSPILDFLFDPLFFLLIISSIIITKIFFSFQKIQLKDKINRIIAKPEIQDWFSDKWEIRTESAILAENGEIKIPDRVLIGSDCVKVIDFKFGEIHDEFRDQVSKYMDLLKAMGYKNIEGFIYYADYEKIITI